MTKKSKTQLCLVICMAALNLSLGSDPSAPPEPTASPSPQSSSSSQSPAPPSPAATPMNSAPETSTLPINNLPTQTQDTMSAPPKAKAPDPNTQLDLPTQEDKVTPAPNPHTHPAGDELQKKLPTPTGSKTESTEPPPSRKPQDDYIRGY